jgi:hypothetical protein
VILVAMVMFGVGFWGGRQFLIHSDVGEALVAQAINSGLLGLHALLNNVTLKTADGTTQIDHILVAGTGIFVIETKHYTGWIFGRLGDGKWTQTFYKNKFRFLNPLLQNDGHLKALQALFTLPESAFISLVVFTGNAEFKTDLGPKVLKLPQLLGVLSEDRPVIFDEKKIGLCT